MPHQVKGKRRTVLLLVSVVLAVLLIAGVAWAATIDCVTGRTRQLDTTNGSEEKDKFTGRTESRTERKTPSRAAQATTPFTSARTPQG